TGAGKSLLVDALELALGERADMELVRSGAAKAAVSAVIDLSDSPVLVARCRELGIEPEDPPLFNTRGSDTEPPPPNAQCPTPSFLSIQREVHAEGRSQCRINGKLTPVSTLKQLGQMLVDLHGQHDHQSLLNPERHIEFLDSWIGPTAFNLLEGTASSFRDAQSARQRLAALRSGMRDREHRLDLLRFQVNEIESIDPKPGELEELEAQLSRLKNIERLAGTAALALDSIRGSERNAGDALRIAVKAIEEVIRYDPALEPILESLNTALVQLEEGGHDLARYLDGLESDPARLEEVAGRIDSLRRLRRKYGEDEPAVLAFLEEARRELDMLTGAKGSEDDLVAIQERAEAQLCALVSELSSLRKERAIGFAQLVQDQLRDLAMERALFEVSFRDKTADATGMDEVEFFFSANSGEPPRPLSKIASGGEISRVMLAIKTAMAGRAGVPTLIFDEVDAGLGGKAAAVVARKLKELAGHYQVVVISHLPQIAARATVHYRIEKVEASGRVTTRVGHLHDQDRVEEIARMLAGEQVTPSARANAREMLEGSLGVRR
ncbi:MAG: DNA repair protein RecN, partial [Fimbriimonadales bacterium]